MVTYLAWGFVARGKIKRLKSTPEAGNKDRIATDQQTSPLIKLENMVVMSIMYTIITVLERCS